MKINFLLNSLLSNQVGLGMPRTVLPFWDTFTNLTSKVRAEYLMSKVSSVLGYTRTSRHPSFWIESNTSCPKSQVSLYILGYMRTSQHPSYWIESNTSCPKSQLSLYTLGYTRTSWEEPNMSCPKYEVSLYILGYTRASQLLERAKWTISTIKSQKWRC